MSRKQGFTLVELLVVIGIIALLVAMLLPSLRKARRAAIAVQCASNMRQCAMSLTMYANDFDGRIVSRFAHGNADGTSAGSIVLWPRFISGYNIWGQAGQTFSQNGIDLDTTQYLKPGAIFACPLGVTNLAEGYGKNIYYGFGMYVSDIGDTATSDSLGFTFPKNIRLREGRQYPKIQVKMLNKVRNSQNVIWMADTTCVRNFGDAAAFNDSGVGRNIGSFHPTNDANSIFGARIYVVHDRRANVAFYDGHVESMTAKQMQTETLSKVTQFYSMRNLRIPEEANIND